MPAVDQEFLKRLRTTFNIEADEHLRAISTTLLQLEKAPPAEQRVAAIELAYREAHSLKGASRAVDLTEIEKICQGIEGIFADWKRQNFLPPPEAFDQLHRSLEDIHRLLGSPGAGRPVLAPEKPVAEDTAAFPESNAVRWEPDAEVAVERPAVAETVRIATATLDKRLSEAEEMLMVKGIVCQRAADLREVHFLFERWWEQWTRVSGHVRGLRRKLEQEGDPTNPASVSSQSLIQFLDWNCDYVRSLENKIALLNGRAAQDQRNVDKRVDDLVEGAKKLLMLPFSTLTEIFPKLVRDLSRAQGKECDLHIRGGEVGIDKRILEELKDALIHALRNCVDHGIESAARRVQLHKPIRASITMKIAQVDGNKVQITITDDGAGIDVEKVKASAIKNGAIAPSEVALLNDREALSLIFHSGVTTNQTVTDISGRGLGMAIVRSKVEKLGGKVWVESRSGLGMTLHITLPVTLSTFRGILLTAGGSTFVAPTAGVERVLRVKPENIKTVENREAITVDGRVVSLVRLDAVLELNATQEARDDTAPVLVMIFCSGDVRIGFVIDQLLREEEVVVKPFRRPLARVRNIAGATVLGSGKIVPVLNIADLMQSARKYGVAPARTVPVVQEQAVVRKRILIVEDSITSRMLLKGILESADYEVKTAVDGIDGFTALREEAFDLVVSDVEMPRMNGLELATRIRGDKRLAEMPIVLVTALESPVERERGIDVGANAYLVKSSFDQSNLLDTVQRLIGVAC